MVVCFSERALAKIDWDNYLKPEDAHEDGGNLDQMIDEDLSNVDFTNLPIEFQEKETDPECEALKFMLTGYRYMTKNKAGEPMGVIITQKSIIDDTDRVIMTRGEDKEDGILYYTKYLNCFEQDNELLIDHIKNKLLLPPNGEDLKLAAPLEENIDGEVGQPLDVDRIVFGGELKNGFFLEAGAFDGEFNSDSLYFEMNHGWTGLLVEPHPYAVNEIQDRNRNATVIQTCLATEKKPQMVKFDMVGSLRNETHREAMMGITVDPFDEQHIQMQCMPIYSILLAMGNPTVNYFSLDVEGAEFAILKTIPWDKVDIQVMSIESHLLNRIFPGTREEMISFLDEAGYNYIPWGHTSSNPGRLRINTNDDLFVRKDIPLKLTKEEKEKLYLEEGKVWEEKQAEEYMQNKVSDEYTYNREQYRLNKQIKKDEL